MSKYGLPLGHRLTWKKGERPTGLMRVIEVRSSWRVELTGPQVRGGITVMQVVCQEHAPGWRVRFRMGPTWQRLTAVFETADLAKAGADEWLVKNSRAWKQYLPTEI